ncbi:hypothetical protein JRA82_004653, partial [Raoultella ornithinolytica]|nr:hypothetical protein [Raoultella ornithinolytica]
MPFYLTRDPVPSADMRNVFDNAQHLDFALNDITSSFWTDRLGRKRTSWFGLESAFAVKITDFEFRFSTQLAEQESAFDAAQADKEARFVHFLDSSGYVFLGDYEDGPFQFSARNQYIRFQGQFFRLSKETDTGFTTTGTDETTFANDVTHLVLMDGDTLRQNLGSSELPGAGLVSLKHGTVADAIKWVTPLAFSSLEACFQSGVEDVLIPAGTYTITKKMRVDITHNLNIVCQPGTVFKLADNVRQNMLVFVGNGTNN